MLLRSLQIHRWLGHLFEVLELKKRQLVMSTVAGCLLGLLGVAVPHSFFWGEFGEARTDFGPRAQK